MLHSSNIADLSFSKQDFSFYQLLTMYTQYCCQIYNTFWWSNYDSLAQNRCIDIKSSNLRFFDY